jgi:hypothetical protein
MSSILQTPTPTGISFMSAAEDDVSVAPILQAEFPNLQSQVTAFLNLIQDETTRILLGKVLSDLVFLLDYLSLVETNPHEPSRILERLSILHAVRGEACALGDFIESHALNIPGLDQKLVSALDATAYAIRHEVRRVFDGDLDRGKSDTNDEYVYGSLSHTQGVLTNCFQQCMINLIRVFDSNVSGPRIFQDWKIRRDRSMILAQDLAALAHMVHHPDQTSLEIIVESLKSFKKGSMQWLMYKDWHEYDVLAQQVIAATRRGESPETHLHRLRCYLETLLAHVRARAVLSEDQTNHDEVFPLTATLLQLED